MSHAIVRVADVVMGFADPAETQRPNSHPRLLVSVSHVVCF